MHVPTSYAPWLHSTLRSAPRQLTTALNVTVRDASQEDVSHASDQVEVWLLVGPEAAEFAAGGLAADVGLLPLSWWQLLPQYRKALALHNRSVVALPLGASPLLLYARGDVLTAAGEQVRQPCSWPC